MLLSAENSSDRGTNVLSCMCGGAGNAATTKRGDGGDPQDEAGRHAAEAAQRAAHRGHDGRGGGGAGEPLRRQPRHHRRAGHVAGACHSARRRSGK
jgi:hypothetical protein